MNRRAYRSQSNKPLCESCNKMNPTAQRRGIEITQTWKSASASEKNEDEDNRIRNQTEMCSA